MTPQIYMSEPPTFTVDGLIRELSVFTDEQRSLVLCPCPPFESTGAHDCRIGGSCGLDFNGETRHSRWVIARFRWLQEQKRMERQVA